MALNNAPVNHWVGYFRYTDGGSVPTSYTTAERDALTNVPNGVVIYNSTTNKLNVKVAAGWEAITSA